MARWLPVVYFLMLLVEALLLAVVYAVVQPASGSLLNVGVGTLGLGSMILMLGYSVARRSAFLRDVARLSTWLHLHIFLGLQGVLLALFHCVPLVYREGWPIVVNPGMLNLYAVLIVFGSGLFGRYLYARLPAALQGTPIVGKQLADNRVFRLWIVLHRPIAAAMFLLSFVHVALALMFSPSLRL